VTASPRFLVATTQPQYTASFRYNNNNVVVVVGFIHRRRVDKCQGLFKAYKDGHLAASARETCCIPSREACRYKAVARRIARVEQLNTRPFCKQRLNSHSKAIRIRRRFDSSRFRQRQWPTRSACSTATKATRHSWSQARQQAQLSADAGWPAQASRQAGTKEEAQTVSAFPYKAMHQRDLNRRDLTSSHISDLLARPYWP
jgi:hypothetical protein